MHERFIRGEESVPPGEQIPFEHPLQRVLAEHFHYPAVRREISSILVFRKALFNPELLANGVEVVELI